MAARIHDSQGSRCCRIRVETSQSARRFNDRADYTPLDGCFGALCLALSFTAESETQAGLRRVLQGLMWSGHPGPGILQPERSEGIAGRHSLMVQWFAPQ